MLVEKVLLSPKGTLRRVVPLSEITVPDLWFVAERLEERGDSDDAQAILSCWHLCHDLLATLQEHPDYKP